MIKAIVLLAAVAFSFSQALAADPAAFFVAPDGSDFWTGMLARRNANKTDGPFATVQRARDMVRAIKQANGGKLPRPITIYLRGGTIYLQQPLVLTAEDSGTPECPVAYAAYQNETAVLSAGRRVRGWGKATFNGHDVWQAKVPQLMNAADAFREMWVNGHRRVLARSPNRGFFEVAQVPDRPASGPHDKGQERFAYHEADLKNWGTIKEADIVLNSLWTESHLPIASIDEGEHVVKFTRPSVFKIDNGDKYFIEGAAELLDEPGEWYFDRKTASLFYMPQQGEGMVDSEIVIPWHEQAVRFEGEPGNGRFVEHVHFRGLTFAHSEWYFPRSSDDQLRGGGFAQAAVGVPGAVWGEGVRDCVFDHCTFAHCGNYGLELGRGCQNNQVTFCTFTDLGAGGIKIGTPRLHNAEADHTKGIEVSDCTIADCGRLFPSAVGVWMGQTSDDLIAHNEIRGLWYTGISVGWTWGYGPTLTRNNVIEYNHVHHIGTPADGIEPVLSDMGGIYTLGNQPDSVIRFNSFHDIAGLRYGGWGIYFDEGTSHLTAENNLVYRTTHGGFHQHYGKENTVRNNIFAFGRDAQIQRTRVEDHLSFTFEHNIVYWDHGSLLAGDWSKLNVKFDYNTYRHVGGEDFKLGPRTWEQWRKEGMDEHSQIADPLFTDPEHGDFKLKGDAQLPGFTSFDVSQVGPRQNRAH
jgi:hypothetical protein